MTKIRLLLAAAAVVAVAAAGAPVLACSDGGCDMEGRAAMDAHVMDAPIGGAERAQRPWLGVEVQELTKELADALENAGIKGILVSNVLASSPAEAAGLEKGDIIVRLNGEEVSGVGQFVSAIRGASVGDEIELEVRRGDDNVALTARLGRAPGAAASGGHGGRYSAMGRSGLEKPCPKHRPAAGDGGRKGGGSGCRAQKAEQGCCGQGRSGGCCAAAVKGCCGGRQKAAGCPKEKGPAAGHAMLFARAVKELGLSDEQREKATELIFAYKKRAVRMEADIKVAELELRETTLKDEVDLDKVRAILSEIESKRTSLRLYRYRSMEDFKNILTDEQRRDFRKLYSAHGAAHGAMGAAGGGGGCAKASRR
ncbi:MAG TPA: PDZ domain-containing protein [Deltaproteobacteria bacterium]|nr:PDZ domain-containing protein [Deltaproteobacteria bacterium]